MSSYRLSLVFSGLLLGIACTAPPAPTGPSCPSGAANCNGTCLQTDRDRLNCGTCGTVCGDGEICIEGLCSFICPAPSVVCDEACVDLLTDPAHCGACQQACEAGLTCQAGACELVCTGGTTACADRCVDTALDPAHCGACDTACAPTDRCVSGACETLCSAGESICDGACVNPNDDAAHCGACGQACEAGQACIDGECGLLCSHGTTLCGDDCVHIDHNPAHCGACDNACAEGETCTEGQCAMVCSQGTTLCAGECVHTDHNPAHCGACDTACGGDEVCVEGACQRFCPEGTVECGDRCVTTANDPEHCGACDNACPAGDRMVAICGGGVCSTRCEDGFGDCNGDAGDGCEIDLESEMAHCGACDNACPEPANALAVCAEGSCGLGQCVPGFANCDEQADNGCEVDTNTDAAHCGACGQACDNGQICANGACEDSMPASCQVIEGVTWCYHGTLCGQACNATCQAHGMQPIASDTAWFQLQNTVTKCQAIATAFGITYGSMASYTYGCAEDGNANHNNSPQPVNGMICSTYSGCPERHRTNMDQLNTSCDANQSRVSICPCE
jgi:hypothetical protein